MLFNVSCKAHCDALLLKGAVEKGCLALQPRPVSQSPGPRNHCVPACLRGSVMSMCVCVFVCVCLCRSSTLSQYAERTDKLALTRSQVPKFGTV